MEDIKSFIDLNTININEFDTKLGIQYSDYASEKLKKDYWIVKRSFIYRLDDVGSYVYVPKGYLTDGASVPKVFWNVIPPWGKYGQSCVLHDYLCEYPYYFNGMESTTINRKKVNDIFNDAMKAAKIPSTKRKMIYSGVEFYRYTINDGFEPKNSKKSFTEYELQLHYDKTNEWI